MFYLKKMEDQTFLIVPNFSIEENILELPLRINNDFTPKILKNRCTLTDLNLFLTASDYFLGKKRG
tara:strand:- start:504 stop:701 length:198 start_codon:yes stop_codon:yes gene_type:complete